jgi:hypothetical protein
MEDTGVAKPHTRPPAYSSGRRPPKGPTVAARPKPDALRASLITASEVLRQDGHAYLADAVDTVLEPRGWELLRPPAPTSSAPNLAIHMNVEIRELLKVKAKDAGVSLSADANEAFREFLAGTFVPSKPIRSRRNSGAEKGNLNLGPDADLLQQVQAKVKELNEAKAYDFTLRPAGIVSVYLMQKYSVPDAMQEK